MFFVVVYNLESIHLKIYNTDFKYLSISPRIPIEL